MSGLVTLPKHSGKPGGGRRNILTGGPDLDGKSLAELVTLGGPLPAPRVSGLFAGLSDEEVDERLRHESVNSLVRTASPAREAAHDPQTGQSGGFPRFIEEGGRRIQEEMRQEAIRRTRAGEAVRLDPHSGIVPLTLAEIRAEAIRRANQPTLTQGPLHDSARRRLGPLGRSNFGDVGVGDFVPGVDVGLAIDDLAALRARERAGLDVGTGEKVGVVMGVPMAVLGLGRLSKAGGQLFDRVARRLGTNSDTAVFEKLAKEGIPVSENIAEGKAAIEKALSEQTSVPAAMYRPDVGEITIEFGVPGTLQENFGDGFGLSHIIARRNLQGQDGERFAREVVPEVLAKGTLLRFTRGQNDRRAEIVHRGNVVVLSLFRDGDRETWIITGFRDHRFRTDKGRTKLGRAQKKSINSRPRWQRRGYP